MLPVLQIGPLNLQTQLLAALLAAWLGLAVAARVGRRLGLDGDDLYNAGFYAIAGGVVAGRLGHIAAFWPAYRDRPVDMIGLNATAFMGWAALGGAAAAGCWYVWRHRLPRAQVCDAFAIGGLAAAAVLDAGNLAAGRAFGAPAPLPWAINVWGVLRHPSQVYEMLATLLVLAAVLATWRRAYRPGRLAWVALLGYGLTRLILEPFRAASPIVLGGLRTPQLLGLALVLIALYALRPAGRRLSTPDYYVPEPDSGAP